MIIPPDEVAATLDTTEATILVENLFFNNVNDDDLGITLLNEYANEQIATHTHNKINFDIS